MFKATVAVNTVCQITKNILKSLNVKGLLLDLDNTLTTHDNHQAAKGVPDWISEMRKNNIALIIVSNNNHERIKPFAAMLGLDFVSNAKKPLSTGFKEAQKRLDIPFSELAVVGDQIFTDILGANLLKVKSIYVDPIEHEKTPFFKFKRWLEIPFIPKKRVGVRTITQKDDKNKT